MPPLSNFSDNLFETQADLKAACISLLRSIKPYQSPGGARIKLQLVTGTHFDDTAAQLEGFARPLWAIAALMHSSCLTDAEYSELVEPYVRGLANGSNPEHAEYWGPVVVRDQRMVEMEIISFALLAAPDTFFHQQSRQAQMNIRNWLFTLNEKDFPVTNWLWFRVTTNLALVKVCRVPYSDVREFMNRDLDQMEKFYLDDGWSADGMWNEQGRQADYYSGSFAIQFSQLLYMKMAQDLDPNRCDQFRERARLFAASFWQYFDENGAAIPFGRSLTYRFAFAGFWSAIAFTEVELPAPLNDLGIVKGLLLRHLRWWAKKTDALNIDGTLTIGFTYPNMYMSEDYNSPQSPYWAMKTFVALGLSPGHEFWHAKERPLPVDAARLAIPVTAAAHIICRSPSHHFLLSSGQYCPWPLKATEAKYGKFAYSSHFGFSVPTGPLIQQVAPDSTLALSKDEGDTWRVPWRLQDHSFKSVSFVCDGCAVREIPALESTWKPWKDADIEVLTRLVGPSERWPDWHVRVHEISNKGNSMIGLMATQGGFSIHGRGNERGENLPPFDASVALPSTPGKDSFLQGIEQNSDGAFICSDAGATGIHHIYSSSDLLEKDGEVLKPDSNTNIMWQRTLIPIIKTRVQLLPNTTVIFGVAVFAMGRRDKLKARYDGLDIRQRWEDVPVVRLQHDRPPESEHISIT